MQLTLFGLDIEGNLFDVLLVDDKLDFENSGTFIFARQIFEF
jgi:hypothetical protein